MIVSWAAARQAPLTCRSTVQRMPSCVVDRRPGTAWRRPGGLDIEGCPAAYPSVVALPCIRLPATPCNRKDGPTSRSTFFLHLLRMLSLAAVVGLLMALAVALEGGPRMIAALSIHLAVLIGVAAGSRVEGRATSARGRPRTVASRAPGGRSQDLRRSVENSHLPGSLLADTIRC
jgi:hypothetical protein